MHIDPTQQFVVQEGKKGQLNKVPLPHLALLLLSRPVSSVMCGDVEATVLEFFGLNWVLDANESRVGFFDCEEDAVEHFKKQISKGVMSNDQESKE